MKMFDTIRGQAAISRLAARAGVSEAQLREDMQAALDAAWSSSDPAAKALQEKMWPEGKPTLEQFIVAIARQSRQG